MKRSISVLPRVRRQLPARAAADFPTEQRGRAVQAHNADSKDRVECFEHPRLLKVLPQRRKAAKEANKRVSEISSPFPSESSLHLCAFAGNYSSSSSPSSSSSLPLVLNMLSDHRRRSKPM